MKRKEIIEKYSDAKEIFTLMRRKKMSKKEIVFDWLIALFTPLPGIVDEADAVSDLGAYYLVVGDNSTKLVRIRDKEITEQDIPAEFNKKTFVYNGNKFTKVGKLYG